MIEADDHALAGGIAERAGVLLLKLRSDNRQRVHADAAAHDYIATQLASARPGDVVFSEEGTDSRHRLGADRVWIVDPLDGTREYREAGRADWAVHVALWAHGSLVAGAVALPQQRRVFSTRQPPAVPPREPTRWVQLIASRSRPPHFAADLAAAIGAELVLMGSVGAKVAAVLTGEADAYVHTGGQFEWDSAAPVAVALAAGLHASRLDGDPLKYNRPDPRVPDLLVCRPEFAARIIDVVSDLVR